MRCLWIAIVAAVCWGGTYVAAEPLTAPQRTLSDAGDGSYTIEKEAPADEVKIMGSRDISLVSDDKLVDDYIETAVEIEATKTFHVTSGFTPKQYKGTKHCSNTGSSFFSRRAAGSLTSRCHQIEKGLFS